MARDLNLLTPDFRAVVEETLRACAALGVEMRPYDTVRDPWTQARYWRQSRPIEQIEAMIRMLEAEGAPFLAHVLRAVGPQYGEAVTNALPGQSWHQWGEAVDCFWYLNEDASWSTRTKVRLNDGREMNGYRLYGEEAVKRELISGGFWSNLKDWPHLQKRRGSVTSTYSWAEIDQKMRERFENINPASTSALPVAPVMPPPVAPSEDFVQVVGRDFCLKGKRFKFVGFNIRGLVHYGARYEGDDTFIKQHTRPEHRQQQLQVAYEMGARVVRVFLPHRNARRREVAEKLRELLDIIKAPPFEGNVYLILALTDFLGYGHVPFKVPGDEEAEFYKQGGSHITLTRAFFEGGYRINYLPFVKFIVQQFKDEPNIFAWEVCNEPKVNDDPSLLVNFMHHTAREIRSLAPNHLITTGMISTRHAYMFRSQGDELRTHLYAAPFHPSVNDHRKIFDFLTIHYPHECHGINGELGCNHEDIELAQDKLSMPFIIEEATIEEGPAGPRDRSEDFKHDMQTLFGRGASGYLPWGFDILNIGDGDSSGGIGHHHTDLPQLKAVFKEQAERLASENDTC